jgi:hypothetical protein
LINYFSPRQKIEKKIIKEKDPSQDQLDKQEEIISLLSQRIFALRNRNATFTQYNEMLSSSGAELFRNAALVSGGEEEDDKKR